MHATTIALLPGLSGDEALQRIGAACLDHIVGNESAVLAGMPDGIHQMRVGVRRLRAVLSAFGKMLPDEQRRRALAELRWLGDALGPARNLDVFERELVAPARTALGDAAAERRRKTAYARAARAVRSRRYRTSLSRLRGWFGGCGWREDDRSRPLRKPMGAVAGRVLARRRRVANRRSKGFAEQSPQQRHRLRIALKKLRYATDVLAGLYQADDVGRFSKQLKRLQDQLGAANDIRVGRDIVAEIAGLNGGLLGDAGQSMLAWHERRLAAHEPKLRKRLDRLLDAEPYWAR